MTKFGLFRSEIDRELKKLSFNKTVIFALSLTQRMVAAALVFHPKDSSVGLIMADSISVLWGASRDFGKFEDELNQASENLSSIELSEDDDSEWVYDVRVLGMLDDAVDLVRNSNFEMANQISEASSNISESIAYEDLDVEFCTPETDEKVMDHPVMMSEIKAQKTLVRQLQSDLFNLEEWIVDNSVFDQRGQSH